ncbi:Ion transport 2 domain protein [Alkaliphilus metalliredigens QYMF]|uniref:Ion transport 2 domain protein n=1 Tax=Alkaliphilus metalliredigens (strain QYMF) TaxID=293826 RepID=A6TW24_ALKMQ|nr:potassium channel family protein [Alkaliphilus metalliredigens]ABR50392.1 Ion transport 2 domain protein [Alkaliphilus metalliredigens QYMF]
MSKPKRILTLLVIYIVTVSINIISFAYLYNLYDSIIDSSLANQERAVNHEVLFSDILYFSGITYLTIGYGDFIPIDGQGKFLTVLQGFSGVIINSTFTGIFLYYLVKRRKDVLISNKIHIRYKGNRFYLSVRVGNTGRALVNINRVLEIFAYEDNIRKKKFQLSEEYHFFEKLLYWDIDLLDKNNHKLLGYLKSAVFNKESILLRVSIIATDVDSDESIFTSQYYNQNDIVFIDDYVHLYQWNNHEPTKINWKYFNQTYDADSSLIEYFKNL